MLRNLYLATALLIAAFALSSCDEIPPEHESSPAESIRAAIALPEGGFVLAGVRTMTHSAGSWTLDTSPPPQYDNLYVVRVDDSGDVLWEHDALISDSTGPWAYMGGPIERMTATIAPSGEIAIAGGGFDNLFVIRTDTSGALLSLRQFHDVPSYSPAVTPTSDGGFLFAGIVESHYDTVIVVRTDAQDQEVFRRSYVVGDAFDEILSLQVVCAADDGFILVLRSRCIKYSREGDSLWAVTTLLSELPGLAGAVAEPDGGFVVAGAHNRNPWRGDMTLLRFNATGACLWSHEYELEGDQQTRTLLKTRSGGYALAGMAYPDDVSSQFCLLQTDATGLMTAYHMHEIGGAPFLHSLCSALDGGFLLGGQVTEGDYNYNAVILRTTAQGNKLWARSFGL